MELTKLNDFTFLINAKTIASKGIPKAHFPDEYREREVHREAKII